MSKSILKVLKSIQFKLPLLVVVSMTVALFAAAQVTYMRFDKEMINSCVHLSKGATTLMANYLDAEKVGKYAELGYDSNDYTNTLRFFHTVKESYPDIDRMYVIICNSENATVVFDLHDQISTTPNEEEREIVGSTVEYPPEFKNDIQDLTSGRRSVISHIVNKDGRYVLTTITPIFDNKGKYVCSAGVDFSMEEMRTANLEFIYNVVWMVFLMMLLLVSFDIVIIRRDITIPLRKMAQTVSNFSYDTMENRYRNLSEYEELNIQLGNEIGILYNVTLNAEKENYFYMQNYMRAKESIAQKDSQIKEITEVLERDELTGVGSKTAYVKKVSELEALIEKDKEMPKFAVVVVDVNNLKKVNDTYGHNLGNTYIKGCITVISQIWKHSSIYRIGGDEFVIVIDSFDYSKRHELVDLTRKEFELLYNNKDREEYERYAASIGETAFNCEIDNTYKDAFARADQRMYDAKQEFKKKYGSYR